MRNETLRKILQKDLAVLEQKIQPTLLKIKLVKQQLDLLDQHEAELSDTKVVYVP